MRRLHYNYKEFERMDKRWTGAIIGAAAIVGAAAIGGGVAMYEGGQNREAAKKAQDEYNAQTDYLQLPDYSEATGARQDWAKQIKDWGASPSYGANLSNYDEIFANAAKKINQYYQGTASAPGMNDRLKASAARRGVSESPAADVLMQRSGVEEANKLGDLATTVGTDKANAIETARTNWMSSLQSLAQLKPSFTSPKSGQFGITPASSGMSAAYGNAVSGIQSYANNQNYLNELKKMQTTSQNTPNYGSTTPSSLNTDFNVQATPKDLGAWGY
jgi:hypothetical protein